MFSRHSNGLTSVGLPAKLRSINTNTTPFKLVRDLTVGQLPEPHVHAVRSEPTDAEDRTNEQKFLPNIEVRESSGKGLGLYAVDHILAYTKILEDDALLSLATGEDLPELWQKYCLLPRELQSQFDELSFPISQSSKEETLILKLRDRGYGDDETNKMARVSSRFQANAFKTGVNNSEVPTPVNYQSWTYALFPTVARINHSCTPNAHAHYRPSGGSQLVYSLTEIKPGEEIEISYFDMTMALQERQTRAKSWGFTCSCPACNESGLFRGGQYGALLARVHNAMAVDSNLAFYYTNLEDSVRDAQSAIDEAHAAEYGWLIAALPKLYQSLSARLNVARRPGEEVREALENASRWESKITGVNSPSSEERRRLLRSHDRNVEMQTKP